MTTIAWDGRYLAADTRETWDKSIPTYTRKIEILSPEIIIAYAGTSYIYKEVKEFLMGQRPKLPKEAKASEAILILRGDAFNWTMDGSVRIYTPPHAIGSGWKYAWTLMQSGKSAVEAVQLTSELDIWTNNVVDVYDTKTKKLTLSPFPKAIRTIGTP